MKNALLKNLSLGLLKSAYADEIAHLELRLIRDTQAPRFEALRETNPEIYADFMKARTGPHEVLLKNRRERVALLTEIIEGKHDTELSELRVMSEKEKYLQWIEEEKKNGLIDIHFCLADPIPEGTTEEDIYRELNQMREAPDMPDPEVLGKHSI